MTKLANVLWRHLRRSLTADPGRFAGGSAVSDPLSVPADSSSPQVCSTPRPQPLKISGYVSQLGTLSFQPSMTAATIMAARQTTTAND